MARTLLSALILSVCVFNVLSEIVYPCADASDVDKCLGKYFKKNSKCSLKLKTSPSFEPYIIENSPFNGPYFNMTGNWHNVSLAGLSNSSVVDFFYNTESDKAVLTTFFPYFSAFGNLTVHILVKGKEDFVFDTQFTVFYSNVTITTIFNNYKDLSIDDGDILSFVHMPARPTNDHGASHGADVLALVEIYPDVANFITELDLHRAVFNSETFQATSYILSRNYLNYKVCQFY